MTDREALDIYKNSHKYDCLKLMEADEVACDALQERIERETVCDWCEGGACDVVYGDGFRGEIDNGELVVWNGLDEGVGRRKINYCPMCGRKLKPAMPGEEQHD